MEWATVVTAVVGVAGIVGVSFNAAKQRKVELARIQADDRRRATDRGEERRVARQEAYARLIVALDVLDTYGTGYVPSDDKFEIALHELDAAGSIVELVAPLGVRDAQKRVGAIFLEIATRMKYYAGSGSGPQGRSSHARSSTSALTSSAVPRCSRSSRR
jgi:hypothetical protein